VEVLCFIFLHALNDFSTLIVFIRPIFQCPYIYRMVHNRSATHWGGGGGWGMILEEISSKRLIPTIMVLFATVAELWLFQGLRRDK
jgi:hypothetical protein